MENGYLNTEASPLKIIASDNTSSDKAKAKKRAEFNKESLKTVLYPVLFGILILVLWQTQVLHKILGADTFTLPLPGRIINIIFDNVPAC
jgi:hypothetical protein